MFSCSIAFPELLHPAAVQLRQYAKSCKVSQWRHACKNLLNDCDRAAQRVRSRRQHVKFSPKDSEQVARFMIEEKRAILASRKSQLQMHLNTDNSTVKNINLQKNTEDDNEEYIDNNDEDESERMDSLDAVDVVERINKVDDPLMSIDENDNFDEADANAPDQVESLVWSSDED